MGRHIFLSVLGFSIVAVVLGILLSVWLGSSKPNLGYPWQVEILADGSTQVFQINLGQTRLQDIEKQFNEPAKFTMFVPKEGSPVVEAFFEELVIGGLKAKMVVAFEFTQDQLQAMYDNGVRISTLGSGTRKVTLHPDSIAQVKASAVTSLTYMPAINIEAELIEKRFGQPDQKINDQKIDAVHWLYADKGIDIVISERSKEVFQYVLPARFDTVLAPLQTTNP